MFNKESYFSYTFVEGKYFFRTLFYMKVIFPYTFLI